MRHYLLMLFLLLFVPQIMMVQHYTSNATKQPAKSIGMLSTLISISIINRRIVYLFASHPLCVKVRHQQPPSHAMLVNTLSAMKGSALVSWHI